MTRRQAWLTDLSVAALLLTAYVALLLATAPTLGYARDEGFYFQAARSYEAWFKLLVDRPLEALEQATLDRHWSVNREHPPLMKSLFALSHWLLFEKWRLLPDAGTAMRFPGMVMGGLWLATTYAWGARVLGRLPAVVAAVSLGAMPATFYHSHLDCFDVPVATMWLATTWAYARSLEEGGWRWAVATGLLYGLFLATKHNAWIFPLAVLAHVALTRGRAVWRGWRRGRASLPAALLAMAVLGPLVLYGSWPWLWHDTGRRLVGWAAFHLRHDYYNMEFLGRTYWKPPMPLSYAWVMTAATVPTVTLALSVVGLSGAVRQLVMPYWRRWRRQAEAVRWEEPRRRSTELLWLLCIAASYGPWLSPGTPIFGGTKHWLTAYPFLCLFAAQGFAAVCAGLTRGLEGATWAARGRRAGVRLTAAAAVLVAPIVMTAHSHPWGLSAYVPLVGGAPGAATLGLNRGFWGYQTGALAPFIDEWAPKNASVYVHDTALQSWEQLRADGRVRADLRGTLSIVGSSVALYHHEAHMARVEQQIWVVYGSVSPTYLGVYDGVPIAWLYLHPAVAPAAAQR